MNRRIACIVEGQGEVDSLPLLLRRIHGESPDLAYPELQRRDVLRIPRSRLLRPGELERAVQYAARKAGAEGGVLVLIDSDDDAPCLLGPELLGRARAASRGVRVAVVLAQREYEAWFLASARSLAGCHGLLADLEPPPTPDAVRDAKGWLSSRMVDHRYRTLIHQPKLTAAMDLAQARHAQSFDKFCRDVLLLLAPY